MILEIISQLKVLPTELTEATPVEIDTDLFTLMRDRFRLADLRERTLNDLHVHLDKKAYRTQWRDSSWYWAKTDAEVIERAREIAQEGKQQQFEISVVETLRRYDVVEEDLKALDELRQPYDAEYQRRDGWTRAFLVDNVDGHVHKSRNCSTCRYTTQFHWLTELSGHSEEEIVGLAGERACDICYENYGGGIRELKRRAKTLQELIEGRYLFDPATGCWNWQGAPKDTGYGQIKVGGREGRVINAHKAIYELMIGPVPEGLELDHLCRNRLCVNPEHMEPVTHRENILRGCSPAAQAAKATHCPKGHPYDATNTYWRPDGSGRGCRTCQGWTGSSFSRIEGPAQQAAREAKEQRDEEKRQRDAARDAKAITNPDGSPLRTRYGVVKTVVTAWREVVDNIASEIAYGYERRNKENTAIIAALAVKLGQTEGQIKDTVRSKAIAKLKRDGYGHRAHQITNYSF